MMLRRTAFATRSRSTRRSGVRLGMTAMLGLPSARGLPVGASLVAALADRARRHDRLAHPVDEALVGGGHRGEDSAEPHAVADDEIVRTEPHPPVEDRDVGGLVVVVRNLHPLPLMETLQDVRRAVPRV